MAKKKTPHHTYELPAPENGAEQKVIEPEIKIPLRVPSVSTGKMRPTKLGDFKEVYEYACVLYACFVPLGEIKREIIKKFGLSVPEKTLQKLPDGKTYGPLVDKFRRKMAKSKLRGIPAAYRFKRMEKLSNAFETANDPKDIALLDESIRREMEKCEDTLFESAIDAEMSPQAKTQLIIHTAIKLLNDPNANIFQFKKEIIEAANRIKREEEQQKETIVEEGSVKNVPTTNDAPQGAETN